MFDIESFVKQGSNMVAQLNDMMGQLTAGMDQIASMPEAAAVSEKMDMLHKHMKAGNLQGVLKIQEEILKMKEEIEQENGGTDNSNGQ